MWGAHNLRYGEYKATGSGNVIEASAIHAFDFKYDCFIGLARTPQNQPYLAKWNRPQRRLELLIQAVGKDGKYQTCELETTLHEGVYVFRQGLEGFIAEVSQEEYKRLKAGRAAAQPRTPSAANAKVSVRSIPDGADIEVDGAFVGATPSVLQLDPGEHAIVVSKSGYLRWEKKLNLVAGEIQLNAELQAEKAAGTGSGK